MLLRKAVAFGCLIVLGMCFGWAIRDYQTWDATRTKIVSVPIILTPDVDSIQVRVKEFRHNPTAVTKTIVR